jgi:hypothetical protein
MHHRAAAAAVHGGSSTIRLCRLIRTGTLTVIRFSRAAFIGLATAFAQPSLAQGVDDFVGRWGLAAYWADKDATAAQGWARSACGQPYVISKSRSGNLLMHIADDTKLKEIEVQASRGETRLVPARGATENIERHSRTVSARSANAFTLEWSDPGVASRYGRNVYVRCR